LHACFNNADKQAARGFSKVVRRTMLPFMEPIGSEYAVLLHDHRVRSTLAERRGSRRLVRWLPGATRIVARMPDLAHNASVEFAQKFLGRLVTRAWLPRQAHTSATSSDGTARPLA
jgi:hypothetical protein